jgi:Excalibur calcium-binding domain
MNTAPTYAAPETQAQPLTPKGKRGLIITGSALGGALLMAAVGNIGSDGGQTSTPTTITNTVTVTAHPSIVTQTAAPSTVTVTETPPVGESPTSTESQTVDTPTYQTPSPLPSAPPSSSVYYANCAAARAAGAAPLHVGEPGYRSGLDRDDDGVACE